MSGHGRQPLSAGGRCAQAGLRVSFVKRMSRAWVVIVTLVTVSWAVGLIAIWVAG